MRTMCRWVVVAGLAVSPALARQRRLSESAALKARQTEEMRVLKLKETYVKTSLRDSNLPKPVRIELKHELQREKRKLRLQQKDERQTLKDRERLLKLEMKQLGTE